MSGGWVKCDKDFLDDPRLLAAAIKLSQLYLVAHRTPGGGRDLSPNDEVAFWRDAVTGASLRLWRYAHEHICDDDTLPCDAVTIDSIVGIEGFCDVMPDAWLQILDDGETVKLPGYCAKNNLKSLRKRNSSSAERMRRKRARDRQRNKGRNGPGGDGVTHSVTPTSQSALDQDLDLEEKKTSSSSLSSSPSVTLSVPLAVEHPKGRQPPKARLCPSDFKVTRSMREWAHRYAPSIDVDMQTQLMREFEFKRAYSNWPAVWRRWITSAKPNGAGPKPALTWEPTEPDSPELIAELSHVEH